MTQAKNRTRARGEFPRLNLSAETRAKFNDLLGEAPKLGLDPERVEAAGLPGLRALLALKQAAESGTAKKRDAHLGQLQSTMRLLQYRKHPELVQQLQARAMALQGRGGDTEVAHVTVGEIVLPRALQTRAVIEALGRAAGEAGIPLSHLRVGSGRNSINPRTGLPEFADSSEEPMEEITVTVPREEGLVQAPQDLPDEFKVYGDPGGGVNQYGTPAAMGVIGAASHAWTASGRAPFSVGDLSNSSGTKYPGHVSVDHRNGTGIDIRPIRTDGSGGRTNYTAPDYDREATQRLVDTLHATGGVRAIHYNDPAITGVIPDKSGLGKDSHIHDNHLHVQVDPNWRRPASR
ncbi:MAG: hypothetical protein K1X51_13175 [Rhodospirillaceae bacterium]|nr:hypothetical protein [Rhodospirillaceae bacterium]